MAKEQMQVQSRAFLTRPMKDTVIDYTWRTQGSDILICPACGKHGTPRRYGSQSVILHTELASDIRHNQLLDYCPADTEEIQLILARKEQANLLRQRREERRHQDVETRRRMRAKKGQSIVELSLLIPIICLLLFGTLDIGRLIQAHARITNSANLALMRVQNAAGVNTNSVRTAVLADLPAGSNVTILPSTPALNDHLTVTVSMPFGMITPFVKTMLGQTSITARVTGQELP